METNIIGDVEIDHGIYYYLREFRVGLHYSINDFRNDFD